MRWLLLAAALLFPGVATAQPVDINIVTAIDSSDSVDATEENLELEGLALGVTSPEFLERVGAGRHGAVGFMAFRWSSNGRYSVLVPWMVIRHAGDAERAAEAFRGGYLERDQYGYAGGSVTYGRPTTASGMTDTAGAIEHGLDLAEAAPYPAVRTALNILTDSKHNDGRHPSLMRKRALRQGVTVNAIVFNYDAPPGDDEPIEVYFRKHVLAGPGAFVRAVSRPFHLPAVLERKFLQDMVAMREAR